MASKGADVCPRQRCFGSKGHIEIAKGDGSPFGEGITIPTAGQGILDGLGDQDQGGQLGPDVEPAADLGQDLGGISPSPGVRI